MDYKQMDKIASDMEQALGLAGDIDERVEEEKAETVVPEPTVEASDADVMAYLEAQELETPVDADEEAITEEEEEKCIAAAEKLVAIAKRLKAKKTELTASQSKELHAHLVKIAAGLGDDENGDEPPKKQDVMKQVQQKFSKNGPLKTKIKWKETKWSPQTRLMDLDLNDLRELLTHVV